MHLRRHCLGLEVLAFHGVRSRSVVDINYDEHTPAWNEQNEHLPRSAGAGGGRRSADETAEAESGGAQANIEVDWDPDEPPTRLWMSDSMKLPVPSRSKQPSSEARELQPNRTRTGPAPQVPRSPASEPKPTAAPGAAPQTPRLPASGVRARPDLPTYKPLPPLPDFAPLPEFTPLPAISPLPPLPDYDEPPPRAAASSRLPASERSRTVTPRTRRSTLAGAVQNELSAALDRTHRPHRPRGGARRSAQPSLERTQISHVPRAPEPAPMPMPAGYARTRTPVVIDSPDPFAEPARAPAPRTSSSTRTPAPPPVPAFTRTRAPSPLDRTLLSHGAPDRAPAQQAKLERTLLSHGESQTRPAPRVERGRSCCPSIHTTKATARA